MNVLHVIPGLNREQGGLLSTLEGLCAAWASAGASCTIATLANGNKEDGLFSGAVVKTFAPGRPRKLAVSNGLKTWLAAHAREFDAISAQGIWLSPTRYAFAAALKAKRPFLLLPAGMLDPDALAHHPLRKTLRWWLGERGLVHRSHLLFSTQEDQARAAGHLKLDPSHCHVVPNPLRPDFFDAPDRQGASSPPRVLCLNRVHPRKGVLEWIRALHLLSKQGLAFRATLAGPEEDAAYVRECRIAGRELTESGHLEWAGLLVGAGVKALMFRSDVLVHPAVGYENFGMVIAEAMAAGLAVVASRRALVTPQLERAGIVEAVEPTSQEIAAALAKLLANPAQIVERGRLGRAYAREHFCVEAVGKQLLQVLGEIARK